MIRTPIHTLAALAALLTLPLGFAACSNTIDAATGCDVDGKHYSMNDSWTADDGCNSCACNEDGSWGCTAMACPSCEWNGQSYFAGETFPSGDGCNSCTCDPDGNVGCTLIACVTCEYAGQTYKPGDSFPALDGCNTCTCGDFGDVGCTKLACTCDPESEWWREYVADDPAECQVIDYACPPNTTMFGNACGCGCEQDPKCPEWFDCMPPSPCDFDKIKEECPYSGVAL